MGHLYPQRLDTLLLNRIYAKGSASLTEILKVAEQKKEIVHAAEGTYDEKYMIQMSLESVLAVHVQQDELEPVLVTAEDRRIYHSWVTNELAESESWGEDGESVGDLLAFEAIKFRFVKGQRARYREMVIDHIDM